MKPFSPLPKSFWGLLLLGGVTVANAQFSYTETFKNSTASGWNFYSGNSAPGPRLTSGATPTAADPEYGVSSVIDTSGNGWLRLATTTADQSNAAYFDTALPSSNNTITIRFSVAMWGDRGQDNGGDGLTFFMRDASKDFSVGAFGGSIGYAQKTGIDGVSGGYFGVALDVYGNFSNPTEGRVGGVGARPNAVVVRGPGNGQSGYNYLAGTSGYDYTATGGATTRNWSDPAIAALPYSLSFPGANSRPDQAVSYRNVEITLSSSSQLAVNMQFGEDGIWRNVLTADMSSFARPDMMAFGFSSGTGGANQVYEIGNSFSVEATSSSNTAFWDNGASSQYKGIWGDAGDAENNWTGNTLPETGRNVVFNDAFVSGNQGVNLSANRTVDSMYFSGANAYTLTGSAVSTTLIFDKPGNGGESHLAITNAPTGNADHAINVDVQMVNDLVVDNYVANKTFTFGDIVNTGDHDLTVKGTGTTVFNHNVSGGGALSKEGTGTLEFKSTVTVDSLKLDGGTLKLDSSNINSSAGALTISSNSVIDFGTVGGSVLNFNSLAIAAGVTLTLTNWSDALDYFYVQTQPTAGMLSQIVFAGFGPAAWDPISKQIRPVPEPATYGLMLGGLVLAAFYGKRLKQRRSPRGRAVAPAPVLAKR